MWAPWLRVVRAPLAATAVCDSLACAVLGRQLAGLDPLGLAIPDFLALAATSLALYAFGMAGNDWMDRERDRELAPDRPLPSGQLGARSVALLLVLLAAAALVLHGGDAACGALVPVTLLLACAYNGGLKRRLIPGAAAMGSVRLANASLVPAQLLIVGQAPLTVLLGPLCLGLYSAAIVVLSTTEQGPSDRRVFVARAMAALAFAGAGTVSWLAADLPTLGVFLGYGVVSSTVFGRTPRPGPPKRQVLEMLLGLYWLDLVLITGAGRAGWPLQLIGFGTALLLVYGSQRAIRALRPA